MEAQQWASQRASAGGVAQIKFWSIQEENPGLSYDFLGFSNGFTWFSYDFTWFPYDFHMISFNFFIAMDIIIIIIIIIVIIILEVWPHFSCLAGFFMFGLFMFGGINNV